jgi:RNA polymerase sigma factor (sigma-70 family)
MGTIYADRLIRLIRRHVPAPNADACSDRGLIQRFARLGDEAAFALLVRRHGPMVLRVCRHVLGNADDAEDAFQAVFLVLARRASALRWRESLGGWLHGVAYRVALKARTAALRRRAHESHARRPAPAASPVGEITLREAQTLLNEELNRLPERLRTPLVLCYFEGMTQDQAAQQVGWSLSTLKRRVRRGLDLLRRRLRRRGLALGVVLSLAIVDDGGVISPAVLDGITRASVLFRAGLAATSEASRAAVMAQGFLKTLFWTRLRSVSVFLLAVALAAGGGLSAYQVFMDGARPDKQAPTSSRHNDGPQAERVRLVDPVSLGALRHGGAIAISPDGRTLASGASDCLVKLWDVGKQQERATLRTANHFPLPQRFAHDWPIRTVAFSPDGKTLASGSDDRTIKVWDVATGEEKAILRGHTVFVTAIAFSPDGKTLASASGGQPAIFKSAQGADDLAMHGEIKVWDLVTRQEHTIYHRTTGRITSVAFSLDGKLLASGGWDGAVRLWDVASGRERACLREDGQVTAVVFSPDGKTLASAHCPDSMTLAVPRELKDQQLDRVKLWDLATSRVRARLDCRAGWIHGIAFSPDGRTLASAGHACCRDHLEWSKAAGEARLWDTATGEPLCSPIVFAGHGSSAAFAARGTILAVGISSGPGGVLLWKLEPHRE